MRGIETDLGVGVVEQPAVGGDQITVAIGGGDTVAEPFPCLGQQQPDAPVEPVDLLAPRHRDAHQDDLGDPFRIPLGVGEAQRGSPRSAEQHPSVDPQMRAQPLHVLDQMLGGIHRQTHPRVGRVRQALPAATLVEAHDPINLRVESTTPTAATARAGPAVHDHHRFSVRVPLVAQ